jgi:hypothetical protein
MTGQWSGFAAITSSIVFRSFSEKSFAATCSGETGAAQLHAPVHLLQSNEGLSDAPIEQGDPSAREQLSDAFSAASREMQ